METFSALLAIWSGNSPVADEFPAQRQVTWSFDVFFDLRLSKRLSKQSWGWWFDTLSRQIWRHCNVWDGPVNLRATQAPVPIRVFQKKLLKQQYGSTSQLSMFIQQYSFLITKIHSEFVIVPPSHSWEIMKVSHGVTQTPGQYFHGDHHHGQH